MHDDKEHQEDMRRWMFLGTLFVIAVMVFCGILVWIVWMETAAR